MKSNENIQELKNELKISADKLLMQSKKTLFNLKTANEWINEAKNSPIPQKLFSELWFENELCFLFADTNLGKSILAVQIADSISKGKAIQGFESDKIAPELVVYFDFELSAKQFEARYSENFQNHYLFSEKFLRANINPMQDIPDKMSFEEFLHTSIEKLVVDINAKKLIIDNITYLKSDMEKAHDALPLMKHLQEIKSKYDLSILVLAHTPKRDLSKPITINDIQGSKMLINFADSAFAIGKSYKDSSIRYIKQVKQRNTEEIYGFENVIVCRLQKESNFLGFSFVGYERESVHLKDYTESERTQIEKQIIDFYEANTKMSHRQIAKAIGVNHMKVNRTLDKYKNGIM